MNEYSTNKSQGHNLGAKLQITLSEGLETIGARAFADYASEKRILSVNLPESVTSIGESAFSDCTGLNRETIELQQFNELGTYAFSGCPAIQTVIAGEGVTAIPEGCFSDCSGITSLDMGSVESIGKLAFWNCTGLTSLYLPETLNNLEYSEGWYSPLDSNYKIKAYPFIGCTGVTTVSFGGIEKLECGMIPIHQDMTIEIRSSVKEIADEMFYLNEYSTNKSQGHNLGAKLQITLSEGLETIGARAFADYASEKRILSVNLPESVTSIGESAFSDCTGLNRETIELQQFNELGTYAFSGCPAIQTVIAGEGVTAIPEGCFSSCSGITRLILSDTLDVIHYAAFNKCKQISSVIYNGTEDSWNSVLIEENNSPVTQAVITFLVNFIEPDFILPYGLKEIEDEAFCGIFAQSIRLPESLNNIGHRAFASCLNLRQIIIPQSVVDICDDAFEGCNGLTVFGLIGSYAEQFAKETNLRFIPIE